MNPDYARIFTQKRLQPSEPSHRQIIVDYLRFYQSSDTYGALYDHYAPLLAQYGIHIERVKQEEAKVTIDPPPEAEKPEEEKEEIPPEKEEEKIEVVRGGETEKARQTQEIPSPFLIMEIIDGYNGGGDGRKTVTTAGTAVQLDTTSTPCRRIIIQAERDNTGFIAVGLTSSISATQGSERGAVLAAGDAIDVYTSNLDKVYINSTVNGDGVTYVYYNG